MTATIAMSDRGAVVRPAHSATEAPDVGNALTTVAALLSMLHELEGANSATRLFRDRPVLAWTLDRLAAAGQIASGAILCWDDQLAVAERVATECNARARSSAGAAPFQVISQGLRAIVPQLEAVAAARRWADGWRGGLLATCDFDLGFHPSAVQAALQRLDAEAVVLVDPSAALVDPALIDAVIHHAQAHPDSELCFSPAAPGLCGPLVRKVLVDRLAAARMCPGRLLHYHPDVLSREPLAGEACVPVETPIARSTARFTLSSQRQINRLDAAAHDLNGQLMTTPAGELVRRIGQSTPIAPLPSEIVLELNTERATRPIFWPGRYHAIHRAALSLDVAARIFDQLAEADESRLTIAGVGDPILAPALFDVIDAAQRAGLAVHVETDLVTPDVDAVRRLAASAIDVVSVHLPALTPATYAAVMGADVYRNVLTNVEAFVAERAARGRGVPLVAPRFVKCPQNLAEMEPWYDQWLRAVGSAVIVGPSGCAAQVPDVSVADMTPPMRRPCHRIGQRMTILSDGRIVSCEEDVLGRQVLGDAGKDSLRQVWAGQFGALRAEHRAGRLTTRPLCSGCKEWHRP